jgi:hypothetical protein
VICGGFPGRQLTGHIPIRIADISRRVRGVMCRQWRLGEDPLSECQHALTFCVIVDGDKGSCLTNKELSNDLSRALTFMTVRLTSFAIAKQP